MSQISFDFFFYRVLGLSVRLHLHSDLYLRPSSLLWYYPCSYTFLTRSRGDLLLHFPFPLQPLRISRINNAPPRIPTRDPNPKRSYSLPPSFLPLPRFYAMRYEALSYPALLYLSYYSLVSAKEKQKTETKPMRKRGNAETSVDEDADAETTDECEDESESKGSTAAQNREQGGSKEGTEVYMSTCLPTCLH